MRRQPVDLLSRLGTAALVAFIPLLWVVTVAPAPVSFALSAVLSTAWCIWLESHPE